MAAFNPGTGTSYVELSRGKWPNGFIPRSLIARRIHLSLTFLNFIKNCSSRSDVHTSSASEIVGLHVCLRTLCQRESVMSVFIN